MSYTFELDTTTNTAGYDIDTVVTIAGWFENGSALANQAYELLMRKVGSDDFESLGHFESTDFSESDNNFSGSSRLAISGTGGYLATNVDAVRFILADHGIANGNIALDGTVYQEFDVHGVASVPEPGTLLLLSCVGLFFTRPRRS